jgi:hypothetical protein
VKATPANKGKKPAIFNSLLFPQHPIRSLATGGWFR